MTDLPPELSALLDAARVDHDPQAADAERVRARLYASLAVAAVPGTEQALTAKAGSSGLLSAQLTSKLVVAALVLGGGAGLWAWQQAATPRPLPAASVRQSSPSPPVVAVPAPAARDVAPATTQVPQANEPIGARTPRSRPASQRERAGSPSARTSTQLSPRAAAAAGAGSAGAAPEQTRQAEATPAEQPAEQPAARPAERTNSAEELGLLRDALAAINAAQPARALALLENHGQRYPGGLLAEERAGLRVLALCALHRVELAQAERAAFLRDHAASPLAARVRAACQEREP